MPPTAVTNTHPTKAVRRGCMPARSQVISGYDFTASEASCGSFTTIILITEM